MCYLNPNNDAHIKKAVDEGYLPSAAFRLLTVDTVKRLIELLFTLFGR